VGVALYPEVISQDLVELGSPQWRAVALAGAAIAAAFLSWAAATRWSSKVAALEVPANLPEPTSVKLPRATALAAVLVWLVALVGAGLLTVEGLKVGFL
jgi:hypothetical protein